MMTEFGEYDQADSYVILTSLRDGQWVDADQASRIVVALVAQGWDVEIRSPRRGEAEGTYVRRSDGSLQILGYTIPSCDALDAAVREAHDSIV